MKKIFKAMLVLILTVFAVGFFTVRAEELDEAESDSRQAGVAEIKKFEKTEIPTTSQSSNKIVKAKEIDDDNQAGTVEIKNFEKTTITATTKSSNETAKEDDKQAGSVEIKKFEKSETSSTAKPNNETAKEDDDKQAGTIEVKRFEKNETTQTSESDKTDEINEVASTTEKKDEKSTEDSNLENDNKSETSKNEEQKNEENQQQENNNELNEETIPMVNENNINDNNNENNVDKQNDEDENLVNQQSQLNINDEDENLVNQQSLLNINDEDENFVNQQLQLNINNEEENENEKSHDDDQHDNNSNLSNSENNEDENTLRAGTGEEEENPEPEEPTPPAIHNYDYSITSGEDSGETLTTILSNLSININMDEIASAVPSNPSAISVTPSGNDYTIKSSSVFTTQETLTITLVDGTKYIIRLTDSKMPDHGKEIIDNGDGTYILTLDVTGDSIPEIDTASDVNIVLVYDVSQSMTNRVNGTSGGNASGPRRSDAAENVVHDFLVDLSTYQNEDKSNIQVSLVQFSVNGSQVSGWTNNINTNNNSLANRFGDGGEYGDAKLNYSGMGNQNMGTNWEHPLRLAQALIENKPLNGPIFVILMVLQQKVVQVIQWEIIRDHLGMY